VNKFILALVLCLLWDVLIICGTAYIVFWLNQSGWWFLLAVTLLRTPSESEPNAKVSNAPEIKV
jgi:hypothetical protein